MLKSILVLFIALQTLVSRSTFEDHSRKALFDSTESGSITKQATQAFSPIIPLPSLPVAHSQDLIAYTPAEDWQWHGPGTLTVPILMYHHIEAGPSASRYATALVDFEAQMAWLAEAGYTSIPISLLIAAISEGAELPPRPLVITFDDGWRTVFSHAFPVMQQQGFAGVAYVVTDRLNSDQTLSWEQISILLASGWEIGSHTCTHPNLKENHDMLQRELRHSKHVIEEHYEIDMLTFAYPFGASDTTVANAVYRAGYMGAVGLGGSYVHSKQSLFYLSRIEVQGGMSLEEFSALLPWDASPDSQ